MNTCVLLNLLNKLGEKISNARPPEHFISLFFLQLV